jgi:hypothetical protein
MGFSPLQYVRVLPPVSDTLSVSTLFGKGDDSKEREDEL